MTCTGVHAAEISNRVPLFLSVGVCKLGFIILMLHCPQSRGFDSVT